MRLYCVTDFPMNNTFLLLAAVAGFLMIFASHAQAQYWYRPGYRPYPYGYYGPGYYPAPAVVVTPAPAYYYSNSVAVNVQVALRRRGYYRGPIDGDIGPGSRAAIRAYQYNAHLPITGVIDRPLVRSLGL